MKKRETFGQMLRHRREERDLSRRRLGIKLDCTEDAVANWEMDKNLPDTPNLSALGREFGPELVMAAFPEVFGDPKDWLTRVSLNAFVAA